MNLSEYVKNTITQQSVQGFTDKLWASKWKDFLSYVFLRNRGYMRRKVMNTLNESMELILLCLAVDIYYMKGLILIPIFHIMVNYLQEMYLTLVRTSRLEKSYFKQWKMDLFFIFSVLASGIFFFYQLKLSYKDPTFAEILFSFRAITIIVQVFTVVKTAHISVEKRVRVEGWKLWSVSLATWLVAIIYSLFIKKFSDVLVIAFMFNLLRTSLELIYYFAVRNYKKSLQVKLLEKRSNLIESKTSLPFIVGLSLNFLVLYFLSAHVTQDAVTQGSIYLLISITFLDRLALRPFRSLQVDFLHMAKKKDLRLAMVVFRKCFFIMLVLFVLGGSLLISQLKIDVTYAPAVLLFLLSSMSFTTLVIANRYQDILFTFIGFRLFLLLGLILTDNNYLIALCEGVLLGVMFILSRKRSREFRVSYTYGEVRKSLKENKQLDVTMILFNPKLPGVWDKIFNFLEANKIRVIHIDRRQKLFTGMTEEGLKILLQDFGLHLEGFKRGYLSDWITLGESFGGEKIRTWKCRYPGRWVSRFYCADISLSKFLFRARFELLNRQSILQGKKFWAFNDRYFVPLDEKGSQFAEVHYPPDSYPGLIKERRE